MEYSSWLLAVQNRNLTMPFKKGKSGNPGGRPKEVNELKELARNWSVEAIQRLAFWMKSDNPKASVAACEALLDRGFGKSVQALEVKKVDPFDELSTNDLIELGHAFGVRLESAAVEAEEGSGKAKAGTVQALH